MRIADLDYELPEELIAQRPVDRRDASRLLVVRGRGPVEHRRFHELPGLLRRGDLLIVNDARVLPARVDAVRSTGGRVELLFLSPLAPGTAIGASASTSPEAPRTGSPADPDAGAGPWRVLARPARRVRVGERLTVDGVELEVVAEAEGGERHVRRVDGGSMIRLLERAGRMPLPPYIRRQTGTEEQPPEGDRLDRQRYQTVYAATPGAVAAPTAGLHFTPELLARLQEAGVEIAEVTLHVGPGTFRPVTCDRVEDHVMEAERAVIPPATAAAVRAARSAGRRVLAVGTTSVRTLEHAAAQVAALESGEPDTGGSGTPGSETAPLQAGEWAADLFITPGHRFRVVDGMLTNFHLPRSTPLLMLAAMLGSERLLQAYAEAVRERYRFYSYGDAMLVLP